MVQQQSHFFHKQTCKLWVPLFRTSLRFLSACRKIWIGFVSSLCELASPQRLRTCPQQLPLKKNLEISRVSSIAVVEAAPEFKLEHPVIVIDNYDSFTYNLCQVREFSLLQSVFAIFLLFVLFFWLHFIMLEILNASVFLLFTILLLKKFWIG